MKSQNEFETGEDRKDGNFGFLLLKLAHFQGAAPFGYPKPLKILEL